MFTEELERIKGRKNFYRDNYRRFLRFSMINFIVILVIIVLIIFLVFARETPGYYATSSNGSLWEIKPAPWGSRFPEPAQEQIHRVQQSGQPVQGQQPQ